MNKLQKNAILIEHILRCVKCVLSMDIKKGQLLIAFKLHYFDSSWHTVVLGWQLHAATLMQEGKLIYTLHTISTMGCISFWYLWSFKRSLEKLQILIFFCRSYP